LYLPVSPDSVTGGTVGNDGLTAVGIFTDVSWSYGLLDAEVDILGAMAPIGIEYVGATSIQCRASGWRVVGKGLFTLGIVPPLKDLLQYKDLIVELQDRITKKKICRVTDVKPLGFDSGVAAKQLSNVSVTFKGLRIIEDDMTSNDEDGAAALP
jgi:hypothetical protein